MKRPHYPFVINTLEIVAVNPKLLDAIAIDAKMDISILRVERDVIPVTVT